MKSSALFTQVLSNAVFGLAVVCATWMDWRWLAYAVIGFVWILLGFHALAALPPRKPFVSPVPAWAVKLFDLFVVAHFIYFQWFVTAAAYVMSCVLLEILTQKAEISRESEVP